MDDKNINESNNIKKENKDIKSKITRFKNFEILLKEFLIKIEAINNFYKKFSSNKNIDKTIEYIYKELRGPILFELAVFIRSYKKDFEDLIKLLKNNEKLIKLIEVSIRQKNKKIEENFSCITVWIPDILNPRDKEFKKFRVNFYKFIWNFSNKKSNERKQFQQIVGVLNTICHYYEENNHKEDKKKHNQYNEELYWDILSKKEMLENFFKFIHWTDYILSNKENFLNVGIENNDFITIKKLTEYFNNWLKQQKNIKMCFDELKNNK